MSTLAGTRGARTRKGFVRSAGVALILLAPLADARSGHAQGAAAASAPAQPPAPTAARTPAPPPAPAPAPAGTSPSVKENIKKLAKEVTDPATLHRIKAHEQELETKVEKVRDRQRADHAKARPGDAVELVKKLDQPAPGGSPAAGAPSVSTSGAAQKPPVPPGRDPGADSPLVAAGAGEAAPPRKKPAPAAAPAAPAPAQSPAR